MISIVMREVVTPSRTNCGTGDGRKVWVVGSCPRTT
jgi:hypothetical protein